MGEKSESLISLLAYENFYCQQPKEENLTCHNFT